MLHSLALDGRNQVQQAFQQSKMQYYHTVPLRSSSEVPCPFRESLREEGLSESVQFMLYSATFHKFVDCISAGTEPHLDRDTVCSLKKVSVRRVCFMPRSLRNANTHRRCIRSPSIRLPKN